MGVEVDVGEVCGEAVGEGEGVFGVDFLGFWRGFEEMGCDGLGELRGGVRGIEDRREGPEAEERVGL